MWDPSKCEGSGEVVRCLDTSFYTPVKRDALCLPYAWRCYNREMFQLKVNVTPKSRLKTIVSLSALVWLFFAVSEKI